MRWLVPLFRRLTVKNQKRLKKIEGILTKDETIVKSFDLKNCQVYATDKRLLRLEGRTVRDFDYAHISSVEYSTKRYWGLIIVGLVIGAIGFFAGEMIGDIDEPRIVGTIIGIILVIIGIIAKSEWVEVNVVGVRNPQQFKGSRQDLDSLLKIIREKQANESITSQKEINEGDFTDTLRKLAELRNEGIITQEEFEEKKGKILRDSD